MKQRIFNRGKGWYISCNNRNDPEDKAYVNVGFMRDQIPPYEPVAGNEFVFIDIDIIEWRLNSYKNKPELFVFKYELVRNDSKLTEVDRQNNEFAQSIQGTPYAEKFGGNQEVSISPDDLPFY